MIGVNEEQTNAVIGYLREHFKGEVERRSPWNEVEHQFRIAEPDGGQRNLYVFQQVIDDLETGAKIRAFLAARGVAPALHRSRGVTIPSIRGDLLEESTDLTFRGEEA